MLGELVREPVSVQAYIPHRAPMQVVDLLHSVKNKTAEVTVKINKDHIFLREDETLEDCIFVEMIAQTIAAGVGYEDSLEALEEQEGFLIGVKDIQISGHARLGDTLRITAQRYAQFGEVGVVEGAVYRGDELLARGEIKVFRVGSQTSEAQE